MRFGLLPRDWGSRRLHSLLGLWLALFIIFHLVTNSQAALFFDQYGAGFIHEVNLIHNLPYRSVIEIVLIGLPFFLHAAWGIKFAIKAKYNSSGKGEKAPKLKYGANKAYSWMRIAAYVLLVGLILHVVQMRFLRYPDEIETADYKTEYVVSVSADPGLDGIAARLGAKVIEGPDGLEVVADSSGKAMLFTVRDVMKSWTMRILYSIFVLSGVYHGFRGLWSFAIVWGITLTKRSQNVMKWATVGLMLVVGFLGMAAIWLTYSVTLK